jgi:hypothetical protein
VYGIRKGERIDARRFIMRGLIFSPAFLFVTQETRVRIDAFSNSLVAESDKGN